MARRARRSSYAGAMQCAQPLRKMKSIARIELQANAAVDIVLSLLPSDPHHIDSGSLKDSMRNALLLSFFIANDSWLQRHLRVCASGSALR